MEIKKIDLDETPQVSSEAIQPASPISEANSSAKDPSMSKNKNLPVIILFVLVAVAGIFTGSFLKNQTSASDSGVTGSIQAEIPETGVKVGDVYGSTDERAFKDKVLGVVDKGGVGGEGTHKLLRPGGASQTVCMSSTTIDLDQLVGHQVTLWGETFDGQKCGWLMDVGRARIENLNVPLPTQ